MMMNESQRSLDWSRGAIPISRVSAEDRQATVLVADADPHLREIYRAVLEFHGHHVSVASDGLEALEMVRTLKPDVALLDVDLPHLNGLEAARLLRENPATAVTTLILLSIYSGALDHLRALRAGCTGYLPKPFEPRHLLEEVRRALGALTVQRASPSPARIS
jgi:CheY-like chemotaxis protein